MCKQHTSVADNYTLHGKENEREQPSQYHSQFRIQINQSFNKRIYYKGCQIIEIIRNIKDNESPDFKLPYDKCICEPTKTLSAVFITFQRLKWFSNTF